jgi:hypothetical protein
VNGPFIESVNKTKKKVSVNLPEGFLELWLIPAYKLSWNWLLTWLQFL